MSEAVVAGPRVGRAYKLTADALPGGGRLEGAAPEDSRQEDSDARQEEDSAIEIGSAGDPIETDASPSFVELQAIWQRPWADDVKTDRRAWEVALRKGAHVVDILEGAKAWVAAADA